MRGMDEGQLLAGISATLHDCVLSLDAQGYVRWASAATAEVLRRRPEDVTGGRFTDLFVPDAGDLRRQVLDRLLAGEQVEPFVDAGLRGDGTAVRVQVTLGPVRDQADPGAGPVVGAVVGAVAVLRSVTDLLVDQRELTLALEMSRAHFDQAATPQAILDLTGRLESVNPAWCELFGHGEAWFAERRLLDLVDASDAPDGSDSGDAAGDDLAARLRRLGAGEVDSLSLRCRVPHAGGGDLAVRLDASLLRAPDGRPYAIAASLDEREDDAGAGADLAAVLDRRAWDNAIVLDEDLTITYVAGAVAAMLGYGPEDMVDRIGWEYVHASDAETLAAMVDRLMADPRQRQQEVVRVRDHDGGWRWVEVTAANCLADPDVRGLVMNLADVTDRVRTEEALRLSEAMHRAMVETTQEGILATAPDGLVIFANATAAEILDRPADELVGEDPVAVLGLPGARADGNGGGPEVHEVLLTRPDGGTRVLRVSRRPLHSRNHRLGSLLSVADVTAARQAEDALRSRALYDPVTSLPNRYLFLDRLETAAARVRRSPGQGTAVLFIDVDRFKQVNDRHGHLAGDDVLRALAQRFVEAVRATDTVGRLGGDEFAVICEDTGEDEAVAVARRILAAVEEPVRVEDGAHQVGLSIGVALAPPHRLDELLGRADEAMYHAKRAGGRRLSVAGRGDLDRPV